MISTVGKIEIDWKNLTGLFSEELPPYFAQYDEFVVIFSNPTVFIKAKTANFNIRIRCNLKSKVIYASMFEVYSTKNHFGLIAFKEHVKSAYSMGFNNIKCKASAEFKTNIERYNGHYTWCVLGFSMRRISEIRFLKQMQRDKRDEISLKQLLSTEKGKEYWQKNCFSWNAIFELDPKLINVAELKEYCKKSQIKF